MYELESMVMDVAVCIVIVVGMQRVTFAPVNSQP